MTTAQLAERVPDIPPATLYRHVAILATTGVLEVVRERRSRGSVERTYRLATGAANLGPDDAASMTSDEHMAGFLAFIGAVVGDFARYIGHDDSGPGHDALSYRQASLWLSDSEREDLVEKLIGALDPYLLLKAKSGRTRHLLTTILIPDVEA